MHSLFSLFRFRRLAHALGAIAAATSLNRCAVAADPTAEELGSAPAIPRLDRIPTLDEFAAGATPDGALVLRDFIQREPGDGVPVTQPTTVWLAHDGETLFVLFDCRDHEPERVRGRLSRREAIAADDQVGVFLDTFHDRRRAYLFLANPLGVQSDAIVTDGQNDDFGFDTVWSSDGRLTADGYRVRFAIPFKSLRLAPRPTQVWGIGAERVVARANEQALWPVVTRRVEGTVQQLAAVTLTGVAAGRDFELVPYAVLDANATRRQQHQPFDWNHASTAGLDAKLILRKAFTLDLTVNPDFSQVESDEPQVTSNQRFEVFFPEKRPFFLENAGYFLLNAVDLNRGAAESLFFSRRIADPDGGGRLTGKYGSWTLGALAADDAAPGRRLPAADPAHGSDAAIGVAHLQRIVVPGVTLGAMGTLWSFADRSNQVGAFDLRARLHSAWTLAGWCAGSRTRTAGVVRDGLGANVHLKRAGRGAQLSFLYLDRSPEFQTELGFSPRRNVRLVEHYGEYRWRPQRGPVVAYGPNSFFRIDHDHAGVLQEWIVRFPFQVDLKGRTSFFARHVETFNRVQGTEIRGHLNSFNASTEWWRWLTISETCDVGVVPIFQPAVGRPPEPARGLLATFDLQFRPAPRLQLGTTYLYNRLRTRPGPATGAGGGAILDHHVARGRVAYQFTRALSLRGIVDYEGFLANPEYLARPRSKKLGIDMLLTYLVHPGTACYVGYTDALAAVGDALDPSVAEGSGAPSTLVGRRFFVKMSNRLRF
jgi:hypothetical protein